MLMPVKVSSTYKLETGGLTKLLKSAEKTQYTSTAAKSTK